MLPALIAAAPYVAMGLKSLGGFLTGKAESKDRNRQFFLQQLNEQNQREDARKKALAEFLTGRQTAEENDLRSRAQSGVEATQLDPYAHAKALNAANVRRSFGEGLSPSGQFTGGFDLSALSPENLSNTGDYFYKNVAELQPNVPLSGGAEQFRQTRLGQVGDRKKQLEDLIKQYLESMGGQTTQPNPLGAFK